MKRQKSPVVPIVALGVMAVVVGYFNMKMGENPNAKPPEAPPPPKTDLVGKSRPTEEKSAVASSIKSKLSGAKGNPAIPEAVRNKIPGANDTPMVARPVTKAYKPTPNDSSISTQWYDQESLAANQSKK